MKKFIALALVTLPPPRMHCRGGQRSIRVPAGAQWVVYDPTQLFAQRDRLPWFWFFVAKRIVAPHFIDVQS